MPLLSTTFPTPLTPFIGRDEEQTAISRLLADPTCRLLTLFGPGGIGKTRLVIQSVTNLPLEFKHGVYYISLQPVSSPKDLIHAIVDSLHLPLTGQGTSDEQLIDYLSERETLLVLDNFEHLLDGSDLVVQLLQNTQKVKLIITSREALNLQEEWLYPVGSMPYPTLDHEGDIFVYGAVQLFTKCALRVRPDFSLTDEKVNVLRICQLVDGMPLALEIAASWTKTLTCKAIAEEIHNNIEFLTTSLRNVPQRHRSIQAVFDQTWKYLDEEERRVFKRLSVFREGFDRQAARQIASASISILSKLVNKALLRVETSGRYQIHELLRQYAEERLRDIPEDVTHTHDLHCAYYASFLHDRLDDILGGRQIEVADEIDVEYQNIRSAWQWAVDKTRVEDIIKATHTLATFWQFQCRYIEGLENLEKAKKSLDRQESTEHIDLARLHILLMLAWNYLRVGRLEKAAASVTELQSIYHHLDIQPVQGDGTDPSIMLGIIASIKGDYAEVVRLGEEVLETSENPSHLWNRKFAYYLLSGAALAQGQYERAHDLACEAYAIAIELKDKWFTAYCLNDIGRAAYALGDYDAAKEHYEASYTIREEFNDPEGMALALNHLGDIALRRQEYKEAQQIYQRSFDIYQDINDKGGLATTLLGLANTTLALEDYEMACQHYHKALRIARDIQFMPLIFSLLIGIGELIMQTGQYERGLELLVLASEHPASEYETQERAREAIQRHRAQISPERFAAATERGQENSIEVVVDALLVELSMLTIPREAQSTSDSTRISQPLIDPLTDRELEVLHLIANGLTNKQIAEELFISTGTAKWYTSQIYSKLGVKNRTQAVARARELELIV